MTAGRSRSRPRSGSETSVDREADRIADRGHWLLPHRSLLLFQLGDGSPPWLRPLDSRRLDRLAEARQEEMRALAGGEGEERLNRLVPGVDRQHERPPVDREE